MALSSGAWHVVTADSSGTAWAWGYGSSGQLGRGPVTCPGGGCASAEALPAVDAVLETAAGLLHTILLRADGRVWTTGGNGSGQLADGTTIGRETAAVVPGLVLVANDALLTDVDGDGLAGWREYALGTDPSAPDSNGNGLSDGDEAWQASPTHPDPDGDGVPSLLEVIAGTDPFLPDTDGDGVADGGDAFPLDPARTTAPAPVPGDATLPTIAVTAPSTVRPQ